MRSSLLAKKVASLALTRKADDVIIMDLRKLTSVADFFVVCSADSDVQVRAIADAVEDGLDEQGDSPWHREANSSNWVLLDYVDVVLHVFHKNTRAFYNLEKLWGDAEFTRVHDGPEKIVKKPVKKAAKKPMKKVVKKVVKKSVKKAPAARKVRRKREAS